MLDGQKSLHSFTASQLRAASATFRPLRTDMNIPECCAKTRHGGGSRPNTGDVTTSSTESSETLGVVAFSGPSGSRARHCIFFDYHGHLKGLLVYGGALASFKYIQLGTAAHEAMSKGPACQACLGLILLTCERGMTSDGRVFGPAWLAKAGIHCSCRLQTLLPAGMQVPAEGRKGHMPHANVYTPQ
jgi:hypothetical protein